jgi:hypothetical protein
MKTLNLQNPDNSLRSARLRSGQVRSAGSYIQGLILKRKIRQGFRLTPISKRTLNSSGGGYKRKLFETRGSGTPFYHADFDTKGKQSITHNERDLRDNKIPD